MMESFDLSRRRGRNGILRKNLATYFEVAKDVLLDAGVADLNPNYDPAFPYSEENIITRPRSGFAPMTRPR